MSHYKNQSDMFKKRAEKNKKDGDIYYAKAKNAKTKEEHDKYMAQAQYQYKSQKENELKAEEHKGKSW